MPSLLLYAAVLTTLTLVTSSSTTLLRRDTCDPKIGVPSGVYYCPAKALDYDRSPWMSMEPAW